MAQEISDKAVPPTNDGTVDPQQSGPLPEVQLTPQGTILYLHSGPLPAGSPTAVQVMSSAMTQNSNASPTDPRKKWFEDMRGWIMVVAILVASVTYTTGLSPPGGLWQDDLSDHEAGSPILRDKLPNRYTTFFYANATAFMASLVIIVLLMNEKFYCNRSNVVMLNISMVLDLVAMMIAYAAGSARSFKTSIYLILLAIVVLLFVLSSAHFLPHLCSCIRNHAPWINNCVGPAITRYGETNGSVRAGLAQNSSHSAISVES